VLVLQAPYFKYLSEHSRGELLFGLAEGLHRLGERNRARMYFSRLLTEARNSQYESMAAAWLNDPSGASARERGCVGCHQKTQTKGAQGWKAMPERLEQAALKGTPLELREIRTILTRQLTQSKGQPLEPTIQYAIAYTGWRMSTFPDVPKDEQNTLLDDAVDRLEAVLKVNPNDAEALALVGTMYGQQAGRSSMKAIVLGPRSMSTLERAGNADASNPRVLLLQGISALNTPSAYGGSRDKAEQLLRRSLAEFSREPRTKPWPNWGRYDAHAWLGQVLRRKGDLAGARTEYTKALEIAPESQWVRMVLLPALDRASQR
jgi:tetratricopeptide (TPR) repeat protein